MRTACGCRQNSLPTAQIIPFHSPATLAQVCWTRGLGPKHPRRKADFPIWEGKNALPTTPTFLGMKAQKGSFPHFLLPIKTALSNNRHLSDQEVWSIEARPHQRGCASRDAVQESKMEKILSRTPCCELRPSFPALTYLKCVFQLQSSSTCELFQPTCSWYGTGL